MVVSFSPDEKYNGVNNIHFGGDNENYLLLPMIPSWATEISAGP